MNIDLTSNIVAQYKMNDNAANTTIVNTTDSTKPGTFNVANTEDKSIVGKINRALSFDGLGSDYIDTDQTFQSTFQNSFSLNMWVRPLWETPPTGGRIFAATNIASSSTIFFQISNNSTISAGYATNTNQTSTGDLPLGAYFYDGTSTKWSMLTVIVEEASDGTAIIKIYVDAQLLSTTNGTTNMSLFSMNRNLHIASTVTGGVLYEGDIDNFCIFDKALSQKELLFLYAGNQGTEELEGIIFDNDSNGITNIRRNISHQVPLGDNLVKFYQDWKDDRVLAISLAHDSIIQQNRDISIQRAIIGGVPLSVSVGYDDNIHTSVSDNAGGFYALDVIISPEVEDLVDYNTVASDPKINGIQFGMAKKEGLYYLKTYQISAQPEPNSVATWGGVPMALGLQNELIVRDSGYTTADVNRYQEIMLFGVPIQVGMVDAENKYFLIISQL
jgi:hypothetical protein